MLRDQMDYLVFDPERIVELLTRVDRADSRALGRVEDVRQFSLPQVERALRRSHVSYN